MLGCLGDWAMPNSPAPALILRDGDREELESWTRSTSIQSGLAMRARIILLAAEGEANSRIADRERTTPTTVWKWRGRYGGWERGAVRRVAVWPAEADR